MLEWAEHDALTGQQEWRWARIADDQGKLHTLDRDRQHLFFRIAYNGARFELTLNPV